jgi:hypothetical protein
MVSTTRGSFTVTPLQATHDAQYSTQLRAPLKRVHLQYQAGADPRSYIPGAHWRAIKRWRALCNAVDELGRERFEELAERRKTAALVCVCCVHYKSEGLPEVL